MQEENTVSTFAHVDFSPVFITDDCLAHIRVIRIKCFSCFIAKLIYGADVCQLKAQRINEGHL